MSASIKTGQARMLAVSLLVLLLVVVSALGVIYSSYKSRQLFSEVQQQNREAMRLEEDWGRLLLEQSTWASHARIERLAKSELKMVVPAPETIIVVKR
ncbi:MAG: cell division protein FtsL [Oceanicoccus sp.]|uniref:cell division protein FtsL n=1 Tax=Oceanicoccus sp. TaxID=2691044 RepID=UPI00261495FF|nr:cell division protein FtsL [Oceanicoccus sp.]MDG1773176.1 cell division protein FtsL [Oceanicoccus sp.]